jgi:hypothetical protein
MPDSRACHPRCLLVSLSDRSRKVDTAAGAWGLAVGPPPAWTTEITGIMTVPPTQGDGVVPRAWMFVIPRSRALPSPGPWGSLGTQHRPGNSPRPAAPSGDTAHARDIMLAGSAVFARHPAHARDTVVARDIVRPKGAVVASDTARPGGMAPATGAALVRDIVPAWAAVPAADIAPARQAAPGIGTAGAGLRGAAPGLLAAPGRLAGPGGGRHREGGVGPWKSSA